MKKVVRKRRWEDREESFRSTEELHQRAKQLAALASTTGTRTFESLDK